MYVIRYYYTHTFSIDHCKRHRSKTSIWFQWNGFTVMRNKHFLSRHDNCIANVNNCFVIIVYVVFIYLVFSERDSDISLRITYSSIFIKILVISWNTKINKSFYYSWINPINYEYFIQNVGNVLKRNTWKFNWFVIRFNSNKNGIKNTLHTVMVSY